jgi:hypothetical protein
MQTSTPKSSKKCQYVETVILRFRDLASVEGETIESHLSISSSKGFVWWGWWAKPNEKVPLDCFERFKAVANSSGWEIFLFHSGTGEFHKASCTDIFFDPSGKTIPSPNLENTPEYYNEKPCSAWFKLILNPALFDANQIVHKYSYVHISEAFSEKDDSFLLFGNQIISSENELIRQNRTIWFIKEADIANNSIQNISQDGIFAGAELTQETLDRRMEELKQTIRPLLAYLPETIGNELKQKTKQVEHLTAKIVLPPEEQLEVRLTPLHILERFKQDSQDLTYVHILLGAAIGTILGFLTSIALSKDFVWSLPIGVILGLLFIVTIGLSYFCWVIEIRRVNDWAKIQKKKK